MISIQEGASATQAVFFERQNRVTVFGRFENPTEIQGQMFSELLGLGGQGHEQRPARLAGPTVKTTCAIEIGIPMFYVTCFNVLIVFQRFTLHA